MKTGVSLETVLSTPSVEGIGVCVGRWLAVSTGEGDTKGNGGQDSEEVASPDSAGSVEVGKAMGCGC